MGTSRIVFIFLILTATTLANPLLNPDSLGSRSEKFAADVYKVISSENGNSLFCPISMQSLLALVQSGANGRTLEQMSKALHLSEDKSETQQMFRQLATRLRTLKNVTLNTANKVFLRHDVVISENFQNVAAETFDAEFQSVNFIENEATANEINKWVAEKTEDKISSIVSSDDIDGDTALLLVNALYFKGNWKRFFDKDYTESRIFFLNDTHTAKVDMMVQLDVLEHAANDYAQFVDIPYAGDEFVMTIILPNKRTGLKDVEANINEALKVQDTYPTEVTLMIPRFKIEATIDFGNVLKKLGMTDAFGNKANLTGISADGRHLEISKIVQKSYIDVSENGTEAASVSAAILTDRISSPPYVIFRADHPFLFVIRQKTTGVIEFLGRFTGV